MGMKLDYVEVNDRRVENLPKPYNLSVPFERGWHDSRRRALVIIEHVSSGDLKAGALLADELSHSTYANVLAYATRISKSYGFNRNWSFAFYNFNYMKTYDLDPTLQKTAIRLAARRCNDYIDSLKPDLIIVVGDTAAEAITRRQDIAQRRGWIHNHRGIPLVNTIDFDRAYSPMGADSDDLDDSAVDYANILGYVSRNIANGLLGRHPHDLSTVTPRPIVIKSVRAFDRLMRRLRAAKRIAVDTEGTSLETYENTLQTIQFATRADRGYILPLMHQDSPWTAPELDYIKNTLREFFSERQDWYRGSDTRYLIGQNFGYDIRMLMHWLNLRYWYWPTWDIQAGEFLLDENIKALKKYGTPQYGLAQIFTNYQNDFYSRAEFGKKQRTLIAKVPLDANVLAYCAMDVQSMVAIHTEQLRRSSHMDHDSGSYTPIYHRMALVQQSSMIRVMSAMKYRGTKIDVEYLLNLLKPDSPIVGRIDELTREFYALEEVQRADSILRKQKNIPTRSMFGTAAGRVFDIGTKEHMKILYIDVLGLEPLEVGKNGEPSFDKFFLKAYMESNKACEIVFRLNTLKKIKSSYIDAFFKHIERSHDGRIDQRLRPDFGYIDVVTGRSNSSGPSLQQIPEHSEDAKVVKRMFETPPFTLPYEADYSAHEVRCWSIISGDGVLAKTFRKIHRLITRFRRKPTDARRARLEAEGDPHKVNYSFFTGVPIAKIDKSMRQDSKGITFGSMYGKGAKALARDIKKTLEEAEQIMGRFFAKFRRAGDWLEWAVNFSTKNLYVYSPIGRRRHLFGYMSAHNAVVAAMTRRAKNSPIQGMASDICFVAADLFARALHECLEQLGVAHDSEAIGRVDVTYQPAAPNAMVHDSIKGEAAFDYYLLHLHLLEWAMTNGARDFLKSVYSIEVNAPFDIDMEIGCDWSRKGKWDWTDDGLDRLVIAAIEGHKTLYPNNAELQAIDAADTLVRMRECYERQRVTLDLDTRFPRNTR